MGRSGPRAARGERLLAVGFFNAAIPGTWIVIKRRIGSNGGAGRGFTNGSRNEASRKGKEQTQKRQEGRPTAER